MRTCFLWSCALTLAIVGCDDGASMDKLPITDEAPATVPVRTTPTTQEIIEGPRKDLPLLAVPLIVSVPQSWAVNQSESGRMTFLEGQGPTQPVQVQLARRPPISQLEFDARRTVIEKETKQTADDKTTALRTVGGLTVVERTAVDKLPSTPVFDDKGNVVPITSPPLRWTVTLYRVPDVKSQDVEVFELNFVGLSVEQYEAEKAFLKTVIDSVRYDPAADKL